MVSDAFNSLTRRILTLPKGTAEVHFCFTSPLSPLSSDPSCQLLNTNCWFSVCPCLHTDFWEERCFKEERLFEKDAQSCFLTPLKCNPTHSSQKSFSLLFLWKTVLQFPPEKFVMRTIALVRTIFDWNVRENDAMSLHRGELDHCHFFWAKHVLKHGPWEWWVT